MLGEPPLFDVVFADGDIPTIAALCVAMPTCRSGSNAALLERGVLKGESKYYISLAHTDEDVQHTLSAMQEAIDELARAR